MEITDSFLTLLQSFDPVFTAPTYQTFVVIIPGWILSQRHRYVTEVIFSSGRVATDTGRGFIASSATPPGTSTPSPSPGQVGRHDSRPGRHLLLGRRRHPLSQTRADPLRRRHALRPAHLQSRQIPGQLGTRLGRADPDRRLPRLGTVQSLCLAHRHAPVPQPPRADQGEKDSEGEKGPEEKLQTQARSESSHPT